jgi:hypothetical protein
MFNMFGRPSDNAITNEVYSCVLYYFSHLLQFVCVCVREREREKEVEALAHGNVTNVYLF